jgi:hypothetical protein
MRHCGASFRDDVQRLEPAVFVLFVFRTYILHLEDDAIVLSLRCVWFRVVQLFALLKDLLLPVFEGDCPA